MTTQAILIAKNKGALRPSRNGKNLTRWVVTVLRAPFKLLLQGSLILFVLYVNDSIAYDIAWYGVYVALLMLAYKGFHD